jgi:hypothetical protein
VSRLTGFSISPTGGGLTWSSERSERVLARSVLLDLENRRILYTPVSSEIPDAVLDSAQSLRSHLSEIVNECESDALREPCIAIRGAVRQLLTTLQPTGERPDHLPYPFMNRALETLRSTVRPEILEISQRFDLELSGELRRIVES